MTNRRRILAVVGPTAVGKSALALELAQPRNAALLSADARQVYRGMDIGTNKPTPAEQAQVPHLLIDLITPAESYSVARFLADATDMLDTHRQVVVCGGTGLYVQALAQGLDDIPPTPPAIRQQVQDDLDTQGLPALVEELRTADPATWERIDRNNPARVRRALEVYRTTGQPLSSFQTGRSRPQSWEIVQLGLDLPREELYARIDARVLAMMTAGLLAEVQALLKQYPPDAPGFQTIGYAELVAHLLGRISLDEAVAQIQQHTRNYAKRQLTWFRRQPVQWFHPDDRGGVAHWVQEQGL